MKKVFTVRELINLLLDFNMDAYVKVTDAKGKSTRFDISWSANDGDTTKDTKKTTTEVYFDLSEEENKWMKSIKDNIPNKNKEKELNFYKELLGHTSQDIDTLE